MNQFYIIRPQHLNHNHALFGGILLQWCDEVAFLTATLQYPQGKFVTKALEATEFNYPVHEGDIITILGEVIHTGNTSCRVQVTVLDQTTRQQVFTTQIIMVNVVNGLKTAITKDPVPPKVEAPKWENK